MTLPSFTSKRSTMRIRFLASVLGALSFTPWSAVRGQSVSPVAYYQMRERADSARMAKRYADAEPLYLAITAANSRDPDVWERLAMTQGALGKRDDALRSWTSAWRAGAWPKAEVAYVIAQLHGRAGHNREALDWLDSALSTRLQDRFRLKNDSAFIALRSDPRFRKQAGILPEGLSRDEGWRFDIEYFVAEAQRLSIALERPAFAPAFVEGAKKLSREVPRLSDTRIGFGLSKLAGMLGDGHSYLVGRLAGAPVQFYKFSDGLYIVNGKGAGADLIGSRVEQIGRVSADSALKVVAATVSKDNEMTPLWLGIGLLASPAALGAAGLSDDSVRLTMRIVDSEGKARTVTLDTSDSSFPPVLPPPAKSASAPPLWLSRVTERHWLVPLPELNAVYVQFNQVRDAPNQTVAQFAENIASTLASTGSTNLIVDIRRNSGGRRTLSTPLLLTMAAFKRASPANRVYLIAGRGTFSAAQVFLAQAEWMVDPVYVGEPSSSRPNFVGEDTGVILPYSGMRGSVSSEYHQGTTYQDTRPFIPPDIPVALCSSDYFANRDPAMEAISELLRAKQLR